MMSLATFSPLTNKYTPLYLSPLYIYLIHFCSLLESSHWDPEKGKIYMYVHTSGTSSCLKKSTRNLFLHCTKEGFQGVEAHSMNIEEVLLHSYAKGTLQMKKKNRERGLGHFQTMSTRNMFLGG